MSVLCVRPFEPTEFLKTQSVEEDGAETEDFIFECFLSA